MTDDKDAVKEKLKIKRIEDGVVFYIPKDDESPYSVGDIFEIRKNTDAGLIVVAFVVIDDIKIK